jgi:hypothetical protein
MPTTQVCIIVVQRLISQNTNAVLYSAVLATDHMRKKAEGRIDINDGKSHIVNEVYQWSKALFKVMYCPQHSVQLTSTAFSSKLLLFMLWQPLHTLCICSKSAVSYINMLHQCGISSIMSETCLRCEQHAIYSRLKVHVQGCMAEGMQR